MVIRTRYSRVVQFYFQIVRSNKVSIKDDLIAQTLDLLLTDTKKNIMKSDNINNLSEYNFNKEVVIVLYKILAQTRDIIAGKGEYQLAYVQLAVWWKHYPILAKYALDTFVNSTTKDGHPYGSWKDIKTLRVCYNVL